MSSDTPPDHESSDTPPANSKFRGIRKHKWTDKYQARLWHREREGLGSERKSEAVYLGSYDSAEKAQKAHDIASVKFSDSTAPTNFPEDMRSMTKEEVVRNLRRSSTGFARGSSKYRGVTSRHGKWQARIGNRAADKKEVHLGTYNTEEEAAVAYDTASIKYRGPSKALTNFDISQYDVESILSADLPHPKRRLKHATATSIASEPKRARPYIDLNADPHMDGWCYCLSGVGVTVDG